jgi:two-component system KDP operon response regulator KdpE
LLAKGPEVRLVRAPSPLVLLVDSDAVGRRCLKKVLADQGLRVLEAASGLEALALAETHNPDFVLLDPHLPEIDGLEIIRRLRSWTTTPILILSSRDDERGKVDALDAGANDYLTKPFGSRELLARMRVWERFMKRAAPGASAASVLQAGDLRVDVDKRVAFVRGREVHFTPTEYKLVTLLLRNAGRVLRHEEILVSVWGQAYVTETQYLRVFIGQIRQKIEELPSRPRYLVTEPGVGYRMRCD